jgi:translocation and assembly module TamB
MNIPVLSRWKKAILAALATPVVLLLVLFGILQTPQAKELIVRKVNSLELGQLDIELNNLSGFIPFQIILDRFTCSDVQGQFLDLEDLELKILPWSFSRGGPGIEVLAAQKLCLERAPKLPVDQGPDQEETETSKSPSFSLPFPVFVNALEIHSLCLGAELAGQEVELAVSAQAKVQSSAQWDMTLDVDQIDIQGLQAHLAAAMHEDPVRMDLTGSLHLPNLKVLQPLLNMPVSGAAHLECAAAGPMNNPALNICTEFSHIQVKNIRVEKADLALKPQLNRSPDGNLEQLVLSGELNAADVHQDDTPLLPGPLKSSFQGSLVPGSQDVKIKFLQMTMPGMEAKLRGQGQASGRFQVHLDAAIDDVHAFPQLDDLALHSGLTLKGGAQGNWQQFAAETTVEIFLDDLQGLPNSAAGILGSKPQMTADIELLEGERLRLESLHLAGREIDFQLQAQMGLLEQDLQAEWTLQGPDLMALGLADLSGLVTATGRVSGTFQELQTKTEFQVSDLTGYQLRPSVFSGQINADVNTSSPEVDGNVVLDLRRGNELISLSSNLAFAEQIVRLPDLRLQGPKTELRAQADMDTKNQRIDSELQVTIGQVRALQSFFHLPIQGEVSLSAAVHGLLAKPQVATTAQVKDLQAAGTEVKAFDLQAEVHDVQTIDGNIDLRGKGIVFGSKKIHEFTLTADGSQNQATANVNLTGDLGSAFALRTQAGVRMQESGVQITLPHGDGHFAALPFSWDKSLQASLAEKSLLFSWPELRLGKGMLQIEAKAEKELVQGSVQAQNLDLAQFPLPAGLGVSGETDMDIRLSGTRSSPELGFDMRMIGLRSKLGQAEDRPGISIEANGNITRDELKAQVTLQGERDLDLQGGLVLPVDFTLQPVIFQPGKELSADLQGQANLGLISTFIPMDGQALAGHLILDIDTTGPLPHPPVQGRIRLQDARFENISTGTVLDDIQALIELQGYQAGLHQISATDGEQGTVQVSGEVDFAPGSDPSYMVQTQLDKATLVRMDMATAGISGDVNLQGNATGAKIHGDLKAFPVNIGLPDPAPSGMQGIHIVREQYEPGVQDPGVQDTAPSFAQNTALDLRVSIPGGCYVRGRGLDSEWEGKLQVQGQADQPKISGYVQVMRGHLDLLTKRFTLDKGKITFLSRYPPQPEIDMVASTPVKDLLAKVNISGQATEPSIELSSEPVLPRDEILARILFNRPLREITPVQAVKLALAVRTLTSGGRGGIMSKVRQSMGLDELSIDTDPNASSGVTVGAGKYLNENIYFKVGKGIEENSGQVMVNIQMTPRISFESRAGSEQQGLYVTWSYSY